MVLVRLFLKQPWQKASCAQRGAQPRDSIAALFRESPRVTLPRSPLVINGRKLPTIRLRTLSALLRQPSIPLHANWHVAGFQQSQNRFCTKNKPWKCRGMESMESQEAGFLPFPHPVEIPAGFPHYHGYDGDYHVSEDRRSPQSEPLSPQGACKPCPRSKT